MGERLVDRLRGLRPIGERTGNSDYEPINPDGPEAANVIEKLEGALNNSLPLLEVLHSTAVAKDTRQTVWRVIKEDRAALSLLRGDAE